MSESENTIMRLSVEVELSDSSTLRRNDYFRTICQAISERLSMTLYGVGAQYIHADLS